MGLGAVAIDPPLDPSSQPGVRAAPRQRQPPPPATAMVTHRPTVRRQPSCSPTSRPPARSARTMATTPTSKAPYVTVRLNTSWMSNSRWRRIATAMTVGSARLTAVTWRWRTTRCPPRTKKSDPHAQQTRAGTARAPQTSHRSGSRASPIELPQPAADRDRGTEEQRTTSTDRPVRAGPTGSGSQAAAAAGRGAGSRKPLSSPAAPTRNSTAPASPTQIHSRQVGDSAARRVAGRRSAPATRTGRSSSLGPAGRRRETPCRQRGPRTREQHTDGEPWATSSQPIACWSLRRRPGGRARPASPSRSRRLQGTCAQCRALSRGRQQAREHFPAGPGHRHRAPGSVVSRPSGCRRESPAISDGSA